MKKILTSFLALAAVSLTALSGYSQTITIEGGDGTTYAGLEEAMNAATDGATLLVDGEIEINKRLQLAKSLTIKGVGADAKLTRKGNHILFIDKDANCVYTFKDITIDGGGNICKDKCVLEFSKSKNHVLDNVIIVNSVNTGNNTGVIQIKSAGGVTANGLTVKDCTLKEGSGDIFVGANDRLIVNGKFDASVYLQNNYNFTVQEGFSCDSPVKIYFDGNRAHGAIAVKGTTDLTKVEAQDAKHYKLVENNGNLSADCSYIFIGEKGFTSIYDAVAEVASDQTIIIDGPIYLEKTDKIHRIQPGGKKVMIKGEGENAKIIRQKHDQLMILLNNAQDEFHLSDITLDGSNGSSKKYAIEVASGGAKAYLSNVKFVNFKNIETNGFVQAKSSGFASLDNISSKDCTLQDNAKDIFVGTNSSVQISGEIGVAIFTEKMGSSNTKSGSINAVNLLNTKQNQIKLLIGCPRNDGEVIVNNLADTEIFNFYSVTVTVTKDENGKDIEIESVADLTSGIYADRVNNRIIYSASEPFEFLPIADEVLNVNHNYVNYVANSGKHDAGEYVLDLKDAKFFNLDIEGLTAVITADENLWDLKEANRWNGIVPESVAADDAEAYHAANHWRYYEANVVELTASKITFKAAQAGRYLLTLSLPEEYSLPVIGERSKTYAIEVVPTLNLDGFTDHGVAEGVTTDKKYSKEAIDNLKIYVLGADNKETIVAVHEQNAGWALTDSEDVDLTKCFVATKYGDGNLSYLPEAVVEDEGVEENVNAAPAFRSVSLDGYVSAADGIDLSAAKSLNLIQKVNGVYSDPMIVNFAAERVPTGVEDIEAAEENAEAEYFTLEGIRVEAPLAPGAYVCRRGAKAGVIMVK